MDREYFCYLLGFLWADGHLSKNKYGGYTVRLEIIKSDALQFESKFKSIMDCSFNHRSRENRQEQTVINITNKHLVNLMIDLGYDNRLKNGLAKTFDYLLTDNKIRAFVRGYFDGDGCVYSNPNKFSFQISFSSGYEQNWDYLFNYLKLSGFNPSIKKTKQENQNKYSLLRITNQFDCVRFYNIIYDKADIFLMRKKEKYDKIIESRKDLYINILNEN
jgi:hypothetical protein